MVFSKLINELQIAGHRKTAESTVFMKPRDPLHNTITTKYHLCKHFNTVPLDVKVCDFIVTVKILSVWK